ncbi:hypothetical protein RE432_18420 [Pusillimonas sp. SM2304]|uniref:hypothetical protein n=1 Tax=Pusillimonas sp. SM2304 TaxID=3073241 RepID=UPI0028744D7E|nr:hypothetical protein [Pusillimonas sp. SM2304]MDS1142413.1 hypothetical protein [Pusillimonas sp. SM2304]
MYTSPALPDTRPMSHEALFDQAVNLAYQTFDEPTDGHIAGVYAVLVFWARCGVSVDALALH